MFSRVLKLAGVMVLFAVIFLILLTRAEGDLGNLFSMVFGFLWSIASAILSFIATIFTGLGNWLS